MDDELLWNRKFGLILTDGEKALDLSQMHCQFQTRQQDEESPNNCAIRVYNLSEETQNKARAEYGKVILQAGYEGGPYGVIFSGTIKQFRKGKDATGLTTYLDILAADGDVAYNFSRINQTLAAGSTPEQRLNAAIRSMAPEGVDPGKVQVPSAGGILPRGKVLFGMARAALRQEAQAIGSTWNINNGRVNVTPLDGYLPSEAVVLTAETGLIGRIEQTEDGMQCRALINPKLVIGGLLKLDNKSINTTEASGEAALQGNGQLAFNRYAGLQMFASVSADGLYRIYSAEFVGDTRGPDWYVDLVALEVDPVTDKVRPYG